MRCWFYVIDFISIIKKLHVQSYVFNTTSKDDRLYSNTNSILDVDTW